MNETCAPSFRLSLLVIFCFLILSSAAWGAAGSNHLSTGEVLLSDQSLTLPDGERILHMQIDGNLVLKGPSVSRQLWQSGTAGNPGAYYRMQGDGNFVIYSAEDVALWASHTWGNPGAELVMEEDGTLVIWGPPMRIPIWQTWTSGNPGAYYIMQGDGNLVVYSADDEPLWSSGTWGNPGAKLFFKDGHLGIVSAPETKVLWSSGTKDNPDAKLEFVDGALVIYSADGKLLWNTPTGKYCESDPSNFWEKDNCTPESLWKMSQWEFSDEGDLVVRPPLSL